MASESLDKTLVVKQVPAPARAVHAERHGTLTVLIGADVGAAYPLHAAATVVLGRGPEAEVSVEDDGVSRRHCRIIRSGDLYEIEDLGSTNGTYVDHELARGRLRLVDNSRIQIGNTVLRFALQDRLELEAGRRMYEMTVRDGLTGTYNRRYFEERLTSEFAFAQRHGTSLCVLLIDVDHFKRVNDSFGHQAGDLVLTQVAAQLRSGVRTEDVLARYGGEEFAVIARGIDVAGARLFAERVRRMIEQAHITWEGRAISVTASVGLAHNHSGAAVSRPERLVAAADEALYRAKAAGRNRSELAASPGRYSSVNDDASRSLSKRIWEQSTSPSDGAQSDRRSPSGRRATAMPTHDLDPPRRDRR